MYQLQPRAEKQSRMLFVMGIILIANGAYLTVSFIVALRNEALYQSSVFSTHTDNSFAYYVLLIASVIEFAAGILGLRWWQKPKRAIICIYLGFCDIVLIFIGIYISYVTTSKFPTVYLLAFIPPALYMIGAGKLLKK